MISAKDIIERNARKWIRNLKATNEKPCYTDDSNVEVILYKLQDMGFNDADITSIRSQIRKKELTIVDLYRAYTAVIEREGKLNNPAAYFTTVLNSREQ